MKVGMNKLLRIMAAFSMLVSFSTIGQAKEYLLLPSYVLDVEKTKRTAGLAVAVKDGVIIQIGAKEKLLPKFKTAEKVDLNGLTLMPGLIDAHSHVLLHPYNETGWNDQVLKETWAERALRAGNHLEATLKAGFTSLRDLGSEGAGYTDVGVREALDKGVIDGPRLIVAGRAIVATGSYGPKGFNPSHSIHLGAEEADGNDLVRVVRDQIGNGADFIKVYADYRWGPNGESKPTFSLEELKAIVETATSSGRVTVAHAGTDEGMRRAALAGVQTIEHGSNGTLETFKLMAENNVIFCPTIAASDAISQYRGWVKGQTPIPARISDKQRSMKLALQAGVTMCNGSDVGVFSHGDNVRELFLLEEYGVARADVLKAATIIGAELMGKPNTLGQIKPDFLADIIAVEGDPTTDLSVLKKVSFVMKNGDIYVSP